MYAHATVSAGARLQVPWPKEFNALVYVLAGRGHVGPDRRPVREGQLAVLGQGDLVSVHGEARQDGASPTLELVMLGGTPIEEPVFWYGPFVMNTRDEIVQALEDYQAGRMGHIPARHTED